MNTIIDDHFINKWHPEYDKLEADEKEYQDIVKIVKKEILENKTISKATFVRILRWKSRRLMGIVRLDKFEIYKRGIKKCMGASENNKLTILDELYGVGVPVASTILHFIYPNEFPIIDKRTIETLCKFGYIESKTISQRRYILFRSIVLNIHRRYPQCSLRKIDRALFAYHKITEDCCSYRHENKNRKCYKKINKILWKKNNHNKYK